MNSETTFYPLFPDLLPPLTPEERETLKVQLEQDGLRHPIVHLRRPYGAVIDGWHRFELCRELGIKPHFEQRGLTPEAAKAWIIREHIGRRNLIAYQRAALVLQLKPQIAQEARQRMKTGIPDGEEPLRTNERLAALADVGKDTIAKTSVIIEAAPPYVKRGVECGAYSVNNAYRLTRVLQIAGEKTAHIAGKYLVDDPATLQEIARLESSSAETVDEILMSGYISVADEGETVHVNEGAVKVVRAISRRSDEHRKQAYIARYIEVLIDKVAKDIVIGPNGHVTFHLSEEEQRKFENANASKVIVFMAVENPDEPAK